MSNGHQLVAEALRNAFGDGFRGCNTKTESGYTPVHVMGGPQIHSFASYPVTTVQVTLAFHYYKERPINSSDYYFGPGFIPMQVTQQESAYGNTLDVMLIYMVTDMVEFAKAIEYASWERWNRKVSADIDKVIND